MPIVGLLLAFLTLAFGGSAFETDSRVYEYETEEPEYFHLRILAVNDFHGHIATSSSAFGSVGRADYLAVSIASAAEGAEHSVFVSARDLIWASPLISSLFHDEPLPRP